MIKINLATRKQSTVATAATSTAAAGGKTGTFTNFRLDSIDMDSVRELPIRKIAIMALFIGVANFMSSSYKEEQLAKVQGEISEVSQKLVALKSQIEATKQLDEVKKALEADQLTISTKIETIRKLVRDRQEPPKLLTALSNGIPNDVWISEFGVGKDGIKLKGSSLEYTEISDLVKNLSDSTYFADLKILDARKGKDDLGYEVSDFEVTARKRSSNGQ